MGLVYPVLVPVTLIGSQTATFTRTGAALTGTYTDNTKIFETGGYSEMVFEVRYVTGASETGTTLNIKLEESPNRTNFYSLVNEAATGGTSLLTDRIIARAGGAGTTTYAYSFRIDITYKFMRVSVAEAGVSSNVGTVFIEGTLGGY